MKSGIFELVVAGSYVLIIIAFAVFMSWITIQRRKNADAMRKNVYAKIKLGIQLSSKDVVNIGKSFDLTPFQSRKVIYKIFRDSEDKDSFNNLKKLVQEIETEEPYDDMPDEVKPSLTRLSKITAESNEESDKHILTPITGTLSKYVELKSEQEKLKKQTNRAYVVTVVSFVVGAISFYFTLTSPSAKDIAHEIQSSAETRQLEHNKLQQKDD
ncbi:hypothetical protein KO507_03355 [Gilvimarinus agarilyticus]|uniref:hypothetical protein n=1 Tax=Gilvimarinus sp. 2_MG-2023 TaxID=3062666 RepID=UPI001C0A5F72|nr:hypothetical protein [Gilvimarinus sp. 2_MG-2023]MBU2884799.1 hypothetical protein [Gilvimarinus agarilyticus]MDO6569848.1 hypothetical protein [Gilvimarinus sp. 2_MG-2023]